MRPRPTRGQSRRRPVGAGDAALATVASLLAALPVFLAAVAGLVLTASGPGQDAAPVGEAAQEVRADGLADRLVASPGVGWPAGPDAVQRLGLGAANGSGLQQSSIDALKGALAASAANGKVDYDDARASLGMQGNRQFHLHVEPVALPSIVVASGSSLRVGYVADWASLPTVLVPSSTPASAMPGEADARLNATMAGQTVLERQALAGLGLRFTDRVYVGPAAPAVLVDEPSPSADRPLVEVLGVPALEGDVYPDVKSSIDANLPGRLARHDLLIVGSGVDQSTLTSSAVKEGIRDWVLAGGTLVVLGSSGQNYQWLQPLFSTGVTTVNGVATAEDVSHPLLREPHALAWTQYDAHGRGWDIKSQGSGAHYDDFSHVVVQGGEDLLAVSKDGAFGDGRIILTTYMPREVAGTLGVTEAMRFLENVVLYADRSRLYLEYGPPAPAGLAVSVAVRQSWLWDRRLGQVPVRVEVRLWDLSPAIG